ncbi:hypothetical protein BP6252_14117 [Coleophoma cylindrospora]|uniref:Uncharacterized protein n=1 Tax=Coleophoma cylindrospora TaxID=1849047 RepID=A0A3D8Q3W1_9HELO|nr:hypothetical protein BP6252_14117 [Coleophoma cylindrospora]
MHDFTPKTNVNDTLRQLPIINQRASVLYIKVLTTSAFEARTPGLRANTRSRGRRAYRRIAVVRGSGADLIQTGDDKQESKRVLGDQRNSEMNIILPQEATVRTLTWRSELRETDRIGRRSWTGSDIHVRVTGQAFPPRASGPSPRASWRRAEKQRRAARCRPTRLRLLQIFEPAWSSQMVVRSSI